MTKPPENRKGKREKILGLEAASFLGSHKVRGWKKIHKTSAFLCMASPSLSLSLPPLSCDSFFLVTSYPQDQCQHCHSTPHSYMLTLRPPDNCSSLCFPILKLWTMIDMASWLPNPGHKSQSLERATNRLLWNHIVYPDPLSPDQGWAAMVQMWGVATAGGWGDDGHFPSTILCAQSFSSSWSTIPNAFLSPFSTWQCVLLQKRNQTFLESHPSFSRQW